ncbi:MAG: type II toxin-antitoxin system VapC family toxin [Candidatus Njordarchaeota archaeon]
MRRNLNREQAFIDADLLIYLNCITDEEYRRSYEELYYDAIRTYVLYTDMLVLDELVWVSRKKYNVPYDATLSFVQNAVLPYISILAINSRILDDFFRIIKTYKLKPSDAIHVATMLKHKIPTIISEDDDFDTIKEIKRVWL